MPLASTTLALLIGLTLLAGSLIVPAELGELMEVFGLGMLFITAAIREQHQREAHTREVMERAEAAHQRARILLGETRSRI